MPYKRLLVIGLGRLSPRRAVRAGVTGCQRQVWTGNEPGIQSVVVSDPIWRWSAGRWPDSPHAASWQLKLSVEQGMSGPVIEAALTFG